MGFYGAEESVELGSSGKIWKDRWWWEPESRVLKATFQEVAQLVVVRFQVGPWKKMGDMGQQEEYEVQGQRGQG